MSEDTAYNPYISNNLTDTHPYLFIKKRHHKCNLLITIFDRWEFCFNWEEVE